VAYSSIGTEAFGLAVYQAAGDSPVTAPLVRAVIAELGTHTRNCSCGTCRDRFRR
jgi:hypothetical protein